MALKSQIDALFINPGGRKEIYQTLGANLSAIEPPIWTGLMATFVRKRGFAVDILDTNAEGLNEEEAAKRIILMDPKLAVIVAYGQNPSASTLVMPSVGKLCKHIKQDNPNLKILLAGGHVAALSERTMREESADFVCSGEGPYTIVDLINILNSTQPDNYANARDLLYRDGKNIITTKNSAPLVQDLDKEMPGMAWDLLPMEKYRAHNWHCFGGRKREPYASLYTTLGCPFHCTYCCIQAPFRCGEKALGLKNEINSYRFWSPETVIAQIDKLVNKYGVTNIKFADEMFVLNAKHVNRICDLIIERGYKLNIWAYARIDTMKDMAEKLKKAGVNWLCFGIESGSGKVRDDVHKKLSQELIIKTIDVVRRAGIYVIANYLFGLPEDTMETMRETFDLAKELNCEFANFYCAMAYPGSRLYDTAVEGKWPLPSSWTGYSQHAKDSLPLPTRYLSGVEVLKFRDKAFQEYFNNPKYIETIKEKFGEETVREIKEMSSYKLERIYK